MIIKKYIIDDSIVKHTNTMDITENNSTSSVSKHNNIILFGIK